MCSISTMMTFLVIVESFLFCTLPDPFSFMRIKKERGSLRCVMRTIFNQP